MFAHGPDKLLLKIESLQFTVFFGSDKLLSIRFRQTATVSLFQIFQKLFPSIEVAWIEVRHCNGQREN